MIDSAGDNFVVETVEMSQALVCIIYFLLGGFLVYF